MSFSLISCKSQEINKNSYFLNYDFGGVLVFVTAKVRIWDLKGGIEDEMFTLVEPKPDILKKRVHIISDGKD